MREKLAHFSGNLRYNTKVASFMAVITVHGGVHNAKLLGCSNKMHGSAGNIQILKVICRNGLLITLDHHTGVKDLSCSMLTLMQCRFLL